MMRERQPLVCEYLENLRATDMEKYGPSIRRMIHRRHGVYALYKKDRLYYVGLASNLRNRVRNHGRDKHTGKWDSLSVYLTIDRAHMRELESLLIRIAGPPGNSQKGKFARANNLMRQLRLEVRADHRREIQSLGRKRGELRELLRTTQSDPKPGAPVLSEYVTRSFRIRSRAYKGSVHKGRVLKSGRVRVGSKSFDSPTGAAKKIVGRSVNGWRFWRYERAPGQWVTLNELKRQ